MNHPLHPIHCLDLSAIDAVGFDLDHTLALYDDQAVNLLAADETVGILERRGYARAPLPVEIHATVARGLSMDLRHGNVLKIAADGRVWLARNGSSWLSDLDIRGLYGGYDPADESATWHVHSPFDTPTLWFFSALGPGIRTARDAGYAARLLRDIRSCLDASHTRGELKRHIVRDLSRFVEPAAPLIEPLQRWRQAGKRLFVVTNSDPRFASAVLDHVLGPPWRKIFDLVVTDAGKPGFFADTSSRGAPGRPAGGEARVVQGGNATRVESFFGVPADRILYAGDNLRADIMPARQRGWKAVHVVAEMASADPVGPWAGALAHRDVPTWFARTIEENAHAACARIDALLSLDPCARLDACGPLRVHATVAAPLRPPGDVP